MKIAVIQMDILAGETEGNLLRAEQLIRSHPGADVYLLPEMFPTGCNSDPMACAEPEGGPALRMMCRMAAEMDAAVCGSVATAVELFTFVNRMYFVEPDGTVTHYDKRHLFSYSGEHLHYTAGTERVVVPFRGVRFLLEVCYDLRFPVWSRCRDDYDVALYAACWPVKRRTSWDALLRARAIENQCYVAGTNRVGSDVLGCVYDGGSALIGPYGETLATASDGQVDVAVADIDMAHLAAYRSKFPTLADADAFSINMTDEESVREE